MHSEKKICPGISYPYKCARFLHYIRDDDLSQHDCLSLVSEIHIQRIQTHANTFIGILSMLISFLVFRELA